MSNTKARKTADYYNKLSPRYDRVYSSYLKHTHQKFLAEIEISTEDHVLDISAGTGILASEIIDRFGSPAELVLNDPSKKMIGKAREKLGDQGRVEFRNYFAEELPFVEDRFSVILCLNSFHYYVNQRAVLEHLHRTLKPGGRLYILDWDRTGSFRLANRLISWLSPENINTRSLEEMSDLLGEHEFHLQNGDRWAFRWWKFYYLESRKDSLFKG
ncbi:MAG: class I SAM-dependent methyltransferase [Balneolaceae bacterium]|nr:class I SAM-dependent methyltransferase [Balneolaceae bacterium]MCH8549202.1 class I SAM-dependent methyltransferase [Balneolaceae bacterium]